MLTAYELRHMVAHLAEAGRPDLVHDLLDRSDGDANAWYRIKEDAGEVGDFLDDVLIGRRLAAAESSAAVARGEPADSLVREIRYGLGAASVGSLTRNVPPALAAALVDHGVWGIGRGLRSAARQPYTTLRAEAFALFAARLAGAERRKAVDSALAAARRITRPDWRLRAYGRILTASDGAPDDVVDDVVAEATATITTLGAVDADENIACLLSAVPPQRRPAAWDVPFWTDGATRPGADRIDGRPMPWTVGVRRVAELVPTMRPAMVEAVVAAARSADEPVVRAILLAGCAAHQPDLLPEARAAADGLTAAPLYAEALAVLAGLLPTEERRSRLAAAMTRLPENGADRARTLTALAPLAPDRDALLADALAAASAVEHPDQRSFLLRRLAPELPARLVPDLLADLASLTGSAWGRVVAAVAPRLSRTDAEALLEQTRRVDDLIDIVEVVATLAAAFPPPSTVVEAVLDAVEQHARPQVRAWCLASLAPVLDVDQFTRAARLVVSLDGGRETMWSFARHTTDPQRLAVVDALAGPRLRVEARMALADQPGAQREHLLTEAFALALRIDGLLARVECVRQLFDRGVPAGDWAADDDLCVRLGRLADPQEAATGLALLLPMVPRPHAEVLVSAILAVIDRSIATLPPRHHQRWYEWDGGRRFRPDRALLPTFPYLADVHVEHVLGIIRSIPDDQERGYTLLRLARSRPMTGDLRFWRVAATLDERVPWIALHTGVLPLIEDPTEQQLLVENLLELCREFPPDEIGHGSRATLITALGPYLDDGLVAVAQQLATEIGDPYERDSALAGLAVHRHPDEAEPLPARRRAEVPRGLPDDDLDTADTPAAVLAAVQRRLTDLSAGTREEFLRGLGELTPALTRLASREALGGLAGEVLKAMRWWP